MRTIQVLLCAIVALTSYASAEDPDPNVVPACAVVCLDSAVNNQTACAPTDFSCICASQSINAETLQCVQVSCTIKELLTATKLSLRQCGVPISERDFSIIPLRTTFFAIASALIVIRLFNKLMGFGMKWWWDDYTVIPAYFMGVAMFSSSVLLYNYGLGMDLWDLSFYDITSFMHAFYFCSLVYKIEMAFAKISVCFFFLRIFPSNSFRYYTTAVIVLNAIMGALFFFLDTFQCSPVNAAWKGWAAEGDATCIDLPKAVYVNGFVNIALDVIMISLPIYEVWKLKLPTSKKLNAAVMFGLGFFLTIIGILRNVNYAGHMATTNPTADLKVLHRWALLEVMVSLICACLPDLRILILVIYRHFHPIESTSVTKSDNYSNASRGKASITVTSTFKTDFEVKAKNYDTESQVELVDVLKESKSSNGGVRRSAYLDTASD